MAAAAGTVVPIYVDCTSSESFSDLKSKYEVKGYPTVLYVDPEGKQIKEMGSREAGAITGEINGVAKKFPGRPSLWQNSLKGATAVAKLTKKRIAVYVAKEGADPLKTSAKLGKDLGDRKSKLLWTWETGDAKTLEKRGVESAPAIVIYEADKEGSSVTPLGRVTIKEGDDPKLVNDAIDEILKAKK